MITMLIVNLLCLTRNCKVKYIFFIFSLFATDLQLSCICIETDFVNTFMVAIFEIVMRQSSHLSILATASQKSFATTCFATRLSGYISGHKCYQQPDSRSLATTFAFPDEGYSACFTKLNILSCTQTIYSHAEIWLPPS